jgi:hypothetical protein
METLLQEEFAVISHHADKQLLTLHFVKDVEFIDYKYTLNKLLLKIIETKVTRLLVDQRYADKISMQERAWLISQWFPALQKEVGIQFKMGVISDSSLFSKMGNEYLVNTLKAKSTFEVLIFENMNEALRWINSK